MKTFLNTALALAAVSSLGYAGTGSDADKWSGLDQEIQGLAATQGTPQPSGPQVGALIRSALYMSSDDAFSSGSGDDLLGMAFNDASLWAQGNLGDFFWRLSMNGADPNSDLTFFDGHFAGSTSDNLTEVEVEDAFGKWSLTESLFVEFGNFVAPTTRSAGLGDEGLLFIHRSEISSLFRTWDPGAMIGGNAGQFQWDVAFQNGGDGTDEDYLLSARGQFNLNQGLGGVEGAAGAADGLNGAIGVFYADDGDVDGTNTTDETVIGVDALITLNGNLSVGAEVADFDTADITPWSFVASFLFMPEWEAALRYQEFDDVDDTTAIELGLNFYQSGHNAKWQINFGDLSSDDNTIEGSILALGLTLGASS